MSLLSLYTCPHCKNPFPLFIKPSMAIRRSFFQSPDLKCQNCGQLCRMRINHRIFWPFIVAYSGGFWIILEYAQPFRHVHGAGEWLYFLLFCVVIMIPFFIVIQRGGVTLVALRKGEQDEQEKYNWVPLVAFVIFALLFGFYTGEWSNILFAIAVNFVVGLVFYFLTTSSGKK